MCLLETLSGVCSVELVFLRHQKSHLLRSPSGLRYASHPRALARFTSRSNRFIALSLMKWRRSPVLKNFNSLWIDEEQHRPTTCYRVPSRAMLLKIARDDICCNMLAHSVGTSRWFLSCYRSLGFGAFREKANDSKALNSCSEELKWCPSQSVVVGIIIFLRDVAAASAANHPLAQACRWMC
nr:hypothetical protein CFP56_22342 [Quercus suber]